MQQTTKLYWKNFKNSHFSTISNVDNITKAGTFYKIIKSLALFLLFSKTHPKVGNLGCDIPRHRQTPHRQRLILAIGMNTSPPMDLATSSYLFIGNHPYRQLTRRPVTTAFSLPTHTLPILGTCPKMVSTASRQGDSSRLSQPYLGHPQRVLEAGLDFRPLVGHP